jgi:hypothetical protein
MTGSTGSILGRVLGSDMWSIRPEKAGSSGEGAGHSPAQSNGGDLIRSRSEFELVKTGPRGTWQGRGFFLKAQGSSATMLGADE